MCRNIKTLHHFQPPATQQEVEASALQYVRKLTGMTAPSRANQPVFDAAVREITAITLHLFDHLEVHTPPRTREAEKLKRCCWSVRQEARSAVAGPLRADGLKASRRASGRLNPGQRRILPRQPHWGSASRPVVASTR